VAHLAEGAGVYGYIIACHEDELELCQMELRSLLGVELTADSRLVLSARSIDPRRSPFIKSKLTSHIEAQQISDIAAYAAAIDLEGESFKIVCLATDGSIPYEEQRQIERQIGAVMTGRAEMKQPERLYGIARIEGKWQFGTYERGEAVWMQHNKKPQPYSTALSTRVARAVVNIAVPQTEGVSVIDPCCGIGTVLIEAMSMGISIEGSDMNPLAVKGARVNLAHFGFPNVVKLADMRTLTAHYDAAILDMPYNLCSVLPREERMEMLLQARRLANRVVIVTIEPCEEDIVLAGMKIVDRCIVRKGKFERQIFLCER